MIDYMKVEGAFMTEGDRKLIYRLSEEVERKFFPCHILHIGVETGGSLYCSRAGAPTSVIYGVDLIGSDRLQGTPEQIAELDMVNLRGDSRELWVNFWEPIHFLYIDGDHSTAIVRSDIRKWGDKVVRGGYLALHDCAHCDWAPGVNEALKILDRDSDRWEYCGLEGMSKYYRRL